MEFPVKFGPDDAPANVRDLVANLVPRLIDGDHPALAVLREQLRRVQIRDVEMTGVGFFVNFDVPEDVPLAEARNFAGGSAQISREGSNEPAGCVLFVRGGKLVLFEVFTYTEKWPVDAVVNSIS